jgi:hypothetical protein
MIFIRHCAGEQGWHALHHYANFTIDDPWLRQPYGNLDYKGLLQEMEKHDFHTTIAFIPWNYDRSEDEVISLFRNHPDRFSICVHGNNHDHKEFEDLRAKPLNLQITALKQALARMNKFQTLTGIPYDRAFVFPHSIGPEPTLEELKTYNYLATINSSNVPMDSQRPSSPLFALRPVTTSFADFPSIIRYPATMTNPRSLIAINDFLDNSLFFYAHQDFFASGINAFDELADQVNNIEPSTHWGSLSDIVSHMYQVRLRDDSGYDVMTFSNSLRLENTSGRDIVYHVQKREAYSLALTSVSVDGQVVPFQLSNEILALSVSVPAGTTRSVAISYRNDLDLASISTSRSSLRVYLLRKASDFRDIWVSKYYAGAAITALYYKYYYNHFSKYGVTPLLIAACAIMAFFAFGMWRLSVWVKRRPAAAEQKLTRVTG